MVLRNVLITAAAMAALMLPVAMIGQEPGNVPETKAPAPAPGRASASRRTSTVGERPSANDYWTKHDKQMLTDFGWLARFKEADLALGPPAAGEKRVVFMGDSITEGWKH